MDTDDLKAFVTVADCGGFGRAGDLLGIAQSVVSKRVMRLEAMLGGRLIDRAVRTRIALTREGALFLPEARQAIARAEQAVRIGRNILRGEQGTLRLGFVFSAIMTGLITRAARTLGHNLPALQLELQMLETPEQLRALAEGRIDVGFLRPRLSYPAGTSARIVHSEPVIVGMHRGHRLASATTISGRDLAGEAMIMPQFHEEVGLIDTVRAIAGRSGFAMPELIRTADFVTSAALSAAGLGIVLAPASLAHLHLPGLVYRPLDEVGLTVEIAMVWRGDMPPRALELLTGPDGPGD
ncbi:LysR family transcriptional regulator [Novosphingobium sp.]|uniref:LysR family transcriptional regulator n=1 Tax=Novosphingobium sp. TaxID=1874826 RepID=UPI001EBD36E8|nr:LysR family transcriptional regulator [Novosphingobium sp.]MBK9012501.1 LysR family transcriptional regulator [Novosphingobium sp.]